MGDVAIAWLLSKSYVSTVIIGARNPDQVVANVVSSKWRLTSEEVTEIETIARSG